ncbi:phosphomethylpyrimidine synthase ThiC [Thermodesulfobium sp. 4217-1]|uniref:phosphomethylpyrimidine synthase ThiC n=1 Tax=Thermodesulfobium sp. 4217-1 TaxID=3120013 RepID=UPI003221B295
MTQRESALKGVYTDAIKYVAEYEGLSVDYILEQLSAGTICIPANINHKSMSYRGVGKGLKTKVNANIGTSSDFPNIEEEIAKLKIAIQSGADAVMDLSTGGDLIKIRETLLADCDVPFGTVPIYEVAVNALEKYGAIVKMDVDDFFNVIEKQGEQGVDFITVHVGVTRSSIERLRKQKRTADIVSRGGSFLTAWILHNDKENPLYENYDRLLEIAKKYDMTLSLGDGMRPGALADATDRSQIEELITLGELTKTALDYGVQVMVEGPGHVPIDQIETNIKIQKSLCQGAPFYVLGPLVTDVAPGYDHITSAIGGAIAGMYGADFLCYVTPAEHLGLPTLEDVKDGVIASRIAAHAADIAKGVKGALNWDLEMAQARKALDWKKQIELSVDPEKSSRVYNSRKSAEEQGCSMCGKYCAMKIVAEYLNVDLKKC